MTLIWKELKIELKFERPECSEHWPDLLNVLLLELAHHKTLKLKSVKLKPEMSWVQLLAAANIFTFLYFWLMIF